MKLYPSLLHRTYSIILRTLIAALLLSSPALKGSSTDKEIAKHPDVASNLALFEIWLQAQIAYRGLPGVSVAIVHDQELVYAKGFGYADVEAKKPMTPNSIYRIASHSKLFTAISILQLRDAGKLRLDDPITKYLPWVKIQEGEEDMLPVTIRHLLTHSSGLPREGGESHWTDFNFPDLKKLKAWLEDQSMIYAPETRWRYSNLATTLAGQIIATISGKSFSDYVETEIMAPLDMDSSSVVFPNSHRSQLATGYGRRMPDGTRERVPFVDARIMAPATGVSSSVVDMAKFLSWQFRLREGKDTEILKATTLREMQRPHWVKSGWTHASGLGFEIYHNDARDIIGHAGGYPGYQTTTYLSPEEKVGVVVFTNALDSSPYVGMPLSINDRIFEWIAPAIVKAVEGEEAKTPDPAWESITGTYRSLGGDGHVLALEGELALIDPTGQNPKAGYMTLEPVSGRAFTLQGGGYGPIGEEVRFESVNNGRTETMIMSHGPSKRVTYDVPITGL